MRKIRHRFLDLEIHPDTEILIVGTFNPETAGNPADFFYGRSRNFLWRLLPLALGAGDLKGSSKSEKKAFLEKNKIGFIDLIAEVEVEAGRETDYKDDYIDAKVTAWRNVPAVLKNLRNIRRVCFTRKSFSGVPNIRKQVDEVRVYCRENNIVFQALNTPARIYSEAKQQEWTTFFRD